MTKVYNNFYKGYFIRSNWPKPSPNLITKPYNIQLNCRAFSQPPKRQLTLYTNQTTTKLWILFTPKDT